MRKKYKALILSFAGMLFLSLSFPQSDAAWAKNALVVLPDGKEIRVEIADTWESRRTGLMFREHLDPNGGMLFIFEEEGFHWMWMKNCKIPLDIVWLSEDGKIVHIEHSVAPCIEGKDCRTIGPLKRSSYVLEINAGTALQSALKQGDELLIFWDEREKK